MKDRDRILAFTLLVLFLTLPHLKPIQAENANSIMIVNPQVQPATIRVGDIFAINAI